MNKDVFITSGFLPVPATNGGAVEQLVQNLLDENEKEKKRMFVVFSIFDKKAFEISKKYDNCQFIFYKPKKIIKIIDKIVFFILTSVLKKEKKTSYKFIIQRLFYLNYVSKNLNKNNYNSIIIENNPTLFLALKWRKNYIKYNNKYYYHLHNDLNYLFGCKKIIEGSKKILTVSKYVSSIVEEKLDYDVNDIKILKNCIDMDIVNKQYTLKEKIELKKKLNISLNDKVIIFVGRIIPEKGVLEVIKSFNNHKKENWTLMIVGSAGFNIEIMSDFEKQLYREIKDNKKIVFTGFVSYPMLGMYYSIADLAILPSIWNEPAGLTMLEVISTGVPLITTNSGGIPEYVEKFGAIILNRNNQLVDNIYKSAKDILENNKKIDGNNVKKCREEYGLNKYLKKFCEYIK